MTMPTLIVEVGFTAPLTGTVLHLDDTVRGLLDTGTLATANLFTNVTEYVQSVHTRRGATRADGPVMRYEAGTATIILRNDDRRFDPTNLSGPYVAGGVTQVEPLRAVRIRGTWDGRTRPLWRGFADNWDVQYDGPDSSYVVLTCFDAFGIFAAHDRNAQASAVGGGESTSARLHRILDSIAWPSSDRSIAAGEETVQSTLLADNVLTELQLTADTELGAFFVDAVGRAHFKARSFPYTAVRAKHAQAHFGDEVDDGVETTINRVTNPSVETNTTGWGTGGTVPPSIARTTTQAAFGTYSLLATWGAGGTLPHVRYDLTGLTVGLDYTISVYVRVPSGSLPVTIVAFGSFGGTTSTTDQWERITWSGSATSSALALGLWPVGSPAGGETFYVDGLQVEPSATVTDYVDGDQTGGEWDGVPHASASRRLPELPYADAVLTYDALSITNLVSAARAGGTAQEVEDAASRTAYLTRSHQRHDLIMQTDAEALYWAEQVLARRGGMPELRFSTLLLKPTRDPDRLWPQAFGLEIGDRVRVTRRPPGGGDPVVRDAWVRGVEHDLGKDLDWRTTLTLDQAPDTTTVVDTFTRTTASGWGTADTGEVWTPVSSAAQFSTTGSAARVSVEAVATRRMVLLDESLTNFDAVFTVSPPVVAAGASISWTVLARYVDSDNHYFLGVLFGTGGGITAVVTRRVGGADTVLATVVTGATYTAGGSYRVRVQVAGTLLRVRAWDPIGAEPSTWHASVTDSTFDAAGLVGFRALLTSGNTNPLPVVLTADDVEITSLYAWA